LRSSRYVLSDPGLELVSVADAARPAPFFACGQIWESITEADVLTPREVYDQVASEGYKVNYARIAIVRRLAAGSLARLVC
jgi:hypothetical protein